MIKVPLYSTRKIITLVLGSIGVIGIIFNLLNLFGLQTEWSAAIFPVLLINFYQYFIFKKQFFHVSKDFIEWKFPDLKTPKKVDLTSNTPEINYTWKGITIKDGEALHEISLDGLWKKDRKKIQAAMEEVFDGQTQN